ncbi:MAG: methylmalonyl-CoA mutase family protein [Hyphomicrobiales bacterium]
MSDLPLAKDFPQADEQAWRALVDKALKGADFDKALKSRTLDNIEIKPLYTRKDEAGADGAGLPGSAPFTRGFKPKAAKTSWQVRQLHAAAEPAIANKAILADLEGGAGAIALKIAAPEEIGLAVGSADDIERALEGVYLDFAGVWTLAGANFTAAADALQEVWSRRGIDGGKALGGFCADPLGSMARAGGLPVSLEQSMADAAVLARRAMDGLPKVKALLADAGPYHAAGATEAQEIAFLASTVVAYLRVLEAAGLPPDAALGQIALVIPADADLFSSIAKLRAARSVIARVADACGAADALPSVTLHSNTSARMMTRREPYSNILRTTIACAGAALGGADSITVLPFSWPLGQPDGFARRIARNVQLVLQEESSLGTVADPGGGSWYVEDLSGRMAAEAWKLFQQVEKDGGMAAVLARGTAQEMIRVAANARERLIATGRAELTGVTSFPNMGERAPEAAPWPPAEDLDDPAVTVERLSIRRPSQAFEALRDASDAHLERTGSRPRVYLVNVGAPGDHSARTAFAQSLFAIGGIETVSSESFSHPADAAVAFGQSEAICACLCSSDEIYATQAVAYAEALKSAGALHLYLAGRPGEKGAEFRAAGIETFIFRGCDMLEILREAQDRLGVKPQY